VDVAGVGSAAPQVEPRPAGRPRALETILLGGGAVALLDITNAMTFWALYRGASPGRILQSIAVGLLGNDAFTLGAPSALLGAFLHLLIACGIASVYYAACRFWPGVITRPAMCGMIYGAVVYLVMNQVVVPLSRVGPAPFILPWFLANFIGHVLLVGPPVAFIARWSARRAAGASARA
jgi:uncharacterized membrane protein